MEETQVRSVPWGAGRTDSGPPLGTNAWARWGAICGVLALVPLGLAFGVVALVQTKRSGQRGRGLALLGIVLAVGWASVLWTMGTLPGISVDRGADGSVSKQQLASVFDLQSGDCFRWSAQAPDGAVQMVTLVPCGQQHDARVFATPSLGVYADSDVASAAKQACADAAGHGTAGASRGYLYPRHTGYSKDSRRAICYTTP